MQNVLTTNQKKKRKGFTLIELIIVLAVMAIIAAIAIPNFTAVSTNSKNKADVQSAKTIERNALMLLSDGSLDKMANVYTVSVSGGVVDVTSKVAAAEGNNVETAITMLEEALKDINEPQGMQFSYTGDKANHSKTDKASKYYIDVTATGDVTVATKAPTT